MKKSGKKKKGDGASERPPEQTTEPKPANSGLAPEFTGRARAEAELPKSRNFLQTIIDTEPECVKVVAADGALIMMNPAGLAMIQADSLDRVKGTSIFHLVLPQYRDLFKKLTREVFQGKSGTLSFEMTGFKGRRLWLDTHAVPLRGDDDEIIALLAITRDITERKLAEESLLKSEERYRLLFQRSPIGIFNYNTRLIITDCNDSFIGIMRSSRKKLIGLDMDLLEDRRVWLAHQASVEGDEGFYEGPYHVTTSGSDIWISLRTAPLFGPGGTVIGGVGIVEDITARKQAEESLHNALQRAEEEKNKSAAVTAAIGDGISIQDTDFKVIYQNEHHRKLIGDHVGEYCYAAYEKRETVCEGCPVAMSFRDGKVHTSERSAVNAQGVIHVEITSSAQRDSSGKIIAGIEVARDITARKQMEREAEKLVNDLRVMVDTVGRSRKEWRDTFDSIQDPIFITDSEHRIVKSNKAFAEFTGRGIADVLGMRCHELIHETARPYEYCPYEALKDSGKSISIELMDPARKKNLMVSHFPSMTPEGTFDGAICIVRDVTREREKEMRFIMNERLASLGQMAAGIAHEINNPLAAMQGCAEGLLKRVDQKRYDPAVFRSYLKIIEEEIARCKDITTGMLSFVRKSAPDKKDVDIHEILDRVLEIIGFQGRLKSVEVVKRYGNESRVVYGNESELKQVLLTLITNALDAMAGKGRLTVETKAENGSMFIIVSDTGEGISPEHLTRVFDPFFTTKADAGGTGLGLSIAKKIISNHEGDLRVSSEPGKGTTFTIILPKP
jgi:PAS domain S-box-containing protein